MGKVWCVTGSTCAYLSHTTVAHVTLPKDRLVCVRYNHRVVYREGKTGQARLAAYQLASEQLCLFLFASKGPMQKAEFQDQLVIKINFKRIFQSDTLWVVSTAL